MAKGKKKSRAPRSPKTLGERIRSLRADLTQVEFAECLGIKQAMVSRYEADKETPSRRTIVRIAQFYGVSIEWLLTGKEIALGKDKKPTLVKARGAKNLSRQELISLASQALDSVHFPETQEFIAMMNDLFHNRARLKKVMAYYRFAKKQPEE